MGERDIGSPPAFIDRLITHLRREFADPSISKRYRLRRSKLELLSGIPGSGKSFGILGLWNAMYGTISEVTGVPVEELPYRVMRLRASELLSKWLGESMDYSSAVGELLEAAERHAAKTKDVSAETSPCTG